jgi:hypothetical protein
LFEKVPEPLGAELGSARKPRRDGLDPDVGIRLLGELSPLTYRSGLRFALFAGLSLATQGLLGERVADASRISAKSSSSSASVSDGPSLARWEASRERRDVSGAV